MTTQVPTSSDGRWQGYLTRHCTAKIYSYLFTVVFILAALYLYLNWMLISMPPVFDVSHKRSQVSLPKRDVNVKYFILTRDDDVYMYSAFVYLPGEIDQKAGPPEFYNETDIVITTLAHTKAQMSCCVTSGQKKSRHVMAANIYYEFKRTGYLTTGYMARQYICRVPVTMDSLRSSYITLSSKNCSSDIHDYLPILYPTRLHGGLALCAKIAYGGGRDPEKIIEWFEVQLLLGVDKILLFDLGNPEDLNRVFRYYQKLGILDLQPYELPGFPQNRSLQNKWKGTPQFRHDENMVLFECRQRMAGYDFIISHDLDEFIIPRRDVTLKEFLKEQLRKEPKAAGFHFHTEFFITTWEPTNPEEDLMVKRYRKSTEPRWEWYKYVYLPSRVTASVTHYFYPTSSNFTRPRVPPADAVLHHYRKCPEKEWGTCNVTTNIDDIMTRYHDLDQRVARVRIATSTKPKWTPIKH